MSLELCTPIAPMEAVAVEEIPVGKGWQYEPKWDGFRCLAFRDGADIQLQSKAGQPLGRYFPDLLKNLASLRAKQFVLDGEIVIPVSGRLSFDELLLRIHPAESRVRMLAEKYPAMFVVFDILANEKGKSLTHSTLADRRAALERFAEKYLAGQTDIRLSPATDRLAAARRWFKTVGADLDGVVAKRLDMDYRSGERDGMVKVKHWRTADCVVGGFRYAEGKKVVGSLLLGLYDNGVLNHVGFTASFSNEERKKITAMVEPLIEPPGFTGRAPGGPSRWSTKRSSQWKPLRPKLVVEVQFDHYTGERFRHGTKFLRWRPDKPPSQCTLDQVASFKGNILKLLKPWRKK